MTPAPPAAVEPLRCTAADLLATEIPPTRWVVPGILPAGFALLAGKPKIGKSWLALEVALAVASGGAAIGKVPCERGEVLYLALEDSRARMKSRLTKILAGALAPAGFYLQFRSASWPDTERELTQWLDLFPTARLVVLDTIGKIRPPRKPGTDVYADDYAFAGGIQRLATARGIGLLGLHHLRKGPAADPVDEVSGSTGLTGAADAVLVLKRERCRADGILTVTGRDIEERELALKFRGDLGRWTLLGDAAEYRMSEERAAILDVLDGKALAPKAIADALGKNPNTTRNLLAKMLRDGAVSLTADGKYARA